MSHRPWLLLICTMGCMAAFGQSRVIQVHGNIQLQNESLKAGSVIPDTATLSFGEPGAFLRAIDQTGRTFRLSSLSSVVNRLDQQFTVVNKTMARFKEQVGDLPLSYTQLKKVNGDLSGKRRMIMGDLNKYLIDPHQFPPSKDGKFMIQLSSAGQPTVFNTLHVLNDTLYLRYTDMLMPYPTMRPIKYSLIYKDKNGQRTVADSIIPYFDLTNQLETMVATTINYYKRLKMNREQVYLRSMSQVYHNVGRPSSLDFAKLFDRYYNYRPDTVTRAIELHGTGSVIDYDRSGLRVPEKQNQHEKMNHEDFLMEEAELPMFPSATLKAFAPPPGDQGTTSTCTAWATGYAARSINWNVLLHNSNYVYFSPEFIYNRLQPNAVICNGTNGGITIPAALKQLYDSGDLTPANTVYDCGKKFFDTDIDQAKSYKIVGNTPVFLYTDHPNAMTDEVVQDIKTIISIQRKPVIFSILIPQYYPPFGNNPLPTSFDSLAKHPNDGVWHLAKRDYNQLKDRALSHKSHSLCITGYSQSVAGGSFEVLNSYGKGFGNGGYFWLKYEDFKLLAIDGFAIDNPPSAFLLRAFAKNSSRYHLNNLRKLSTHPQKYKSLQNTAIK